MPEPVPPRRAVGPPEKPSGDEVLRFRESEAKLLIDAMLPAALR